MGQLQGNTSCSKFLSSTLPPPPQSGLMFIQMQADDIRAPELVLLLSSVSDDDGAITCAVIQSRSL